MDNKINLLDKNVSELIAAGEVIERPASIIKELVENSIDAGSTAITVEIRRGGVSYIRVTDNGCGISSHDVKTAFMRHATSKVFTATDLDNISTLGFRGEALASIAAVSRIEVTTKTNDQQFGTKLLLESTDEVSIEETGCANGTTMIVKDLFYNVPARLKFLKKDSTEGNVIAGIIDKLALSHPEISFKLISEFKTRLLTPGDSQLINTIYTIFGKEFAKSLIPVSYEYNGVNVTGYTSNSISSRTNRAMQHFFVNSRYVKSKTCTAAIEEAYKNSVMIGKYPFCVMNVDIKPTEIDVNVHPSKIEIRFINERVVFDAIYFAVKSATASSDELTEIVTSKQPIATLVSTFKNDDSVQQPLKAEAKTTVKYDDITAKQQYKPHLSVCDSSTYIKEKSQVQQEFNYITEKNLNPAEVRINPRPIIKLEQSTETELVEPKPEVSVKIVGELFKTYALIEVDDSFIMLDKHAAHERIIFERLKKSISTEQRQILLKPIPVTLSTDEYSTMKSSSEIILNLGFLLEEFGNNTIVIREAPLVLINYDLQEILLDTLQKLSENKRDVSSDIFDSLLHSIACRSAVKANDITSDAELSELVKQVLADNTIRHCPHGRPIITIYKKSEIEKRFGRIQ